MLSSYFYQFQKLGDDDTEPEFSSTSYPSLGMADPTEPLPRAYFRPRGLDNLTLVDELGDQVFALSTSDRVEVCEHYVCKEVQPSTNGFERCARSLPLLKATFNGGCPRYLNSKRNKLSGILLYPCNERLRGEERFVPIEGLQFLDSIAQQVRKIISHLRFQLR